MHRSALTVVALTTSVFLSSTAFAQQAKPAAPTPAAPAAKTRWVPPIRGTAVINMLQPVTKIEKNKETNQEEVVTRLQVKNMSQGAIALLRIDEYWYDKQGQMLPGDSQRVKKAIQPGEIVEIVLRVPKNPKFFQNQYKFSHANGNVDAKVVKKFD
jgi:hypothetical protein